MKQIIHPQPKKYHDVDLSWMIGRKITGVFFHEPELWVFSFNREATISVECPWRILREGRLACSSDDHKQRFGLPAPIDAATEAMTLLSGAFVSAVQLREDSLDILISFSTDLRLEIIPISRGYESWQMSDPFGVNLVATGGGQICTWGNTPTAKQPAP